MKIISSLVSLTLAASALTLAPSVSANDRLAVNICEYIAADDKNRLRKTLRDARIKIRDVSDDIKCNGNNLVRHAVASNSVDTGEYIIKSLPKSQLEDGADLQWANNNGFAQSPLIAAIKDRAGL